MINPGCPLMMSTSHTHPQAKSSVCTRLASDFGSRDYDDSLTCSTYTEVDWEALSLFSSAVLSTDEMKETGHSRHYPPLCAPWFACFGKLYAPRCIRCVFIHSDSPIVVSGAIHIYNSRQSRACPLVWVCYMLSSRSVLSRARGHG